MGIPATQGVTASGLPPVGDQASAVLKGQITAVGPTAPFAFRGPMNLALFASINSALTTTKGSLSAGVGSAAGLAAGVAINSVNVPPGTTGGGLAGTTFTLAIPPVEYPGILNTQQAQLILPPGCNAASLIGATVTVDPSFNSAQAAIPANTTVLSVVQADIAPSNNQPGTPAIVVISAIPTAAPTNNSPVPLSFARNGNAITTSGADANATYTGPAVAWVGTVQIERSFDGGKIWLCANIGGAGQLAQFTAGPVSVTFGEPEKNVLYRLNCIAYTSGTINYRISQTGGANEALAIGPLANG